MMYKDPGRALAGIESFDDCRLDRTRLFASLRQQKNKESTAIEN
jgi:hypothetical protein